MLTMRKDIKHMNAILSVLLIISMIIACQRPDIHSPDEKIPAILSIVSGKNQPGDNGERLQDPVVIKVTDIENNPLYNVQMTCSVIDGGGMLDDGILLSDSSSVRSVGARLN